LTFAKGDISLMATLQSAPLLLVPPVSSLELLF